MIKEKRNKKSLFFICFVFIIGISSTLIINPIEANEKVNLNNLDFNKSWNNKL